MPRRNETAPQPTNFNNDNNNDTDSANDVNDIHDHNHNHDHSDNDNDNDTNDDNDNDQYYINVPVADFFTKITMLHEEHCCHSMSPLLASANVPRGSNIAIFQSRIPLLFLGLFFV